MGAIESLAGWEASDREWANSQVLSKRYLINFEKRSLPCRAEVVGKGPEGLSEARIS